MNTQERKETDRPKRRPEGRRDGAGGALSLGEPVFLGRWEQSRQRSLS